MNSTSQPDSQIEGYLKALRYHLGPITLTDREEILREISAHIRDATAETGTPVDVVLARLGEPAQLAAQYREGLLLQTASRSLSPLTLLGGTLRVATKGATGMAVFLCGLLGYTVGISLFAAALMKPFAPEHVGIFLTSRASSHSVTALDAAGHVVTTTVKTSSVPHEVLGWWAIPISFIGGVLVLIATTLAIRLFLRASKRLQMKISSNNLPVGVC